MLCALCRQPATKHRKLVRHHIHGRQKGVAMPTMRVHDGSCHSFGDWVTTLYREAGLLEELNENLVIYLYNRVTNLRHGDDFVLHPMR